MTSEEELKGRMWMGEVIGNAIAEIIEKGLDGGDLPKVADTPPMPPVKEPKPETSIHRTRAMNAINAAIDTAKEEYQASVKKRNLSTCKAIVRQMRELASILRGLEQ